MNVVDLVRASARARPDAPALLIAGGEGSPDERVSYATLVRRFSTIEERLRAHGVAEGDRCGLIARQGLPFVEAALGVLAAGGCLAPIPEDTAQRALVAHCAEAHLQHLVEVRGELSLKRLREFTPVDGQGDDAFRALHPAYLRFTSGTTHQRKGVILGHAAIRARLENANRGLAIGPDDRVMWLLPMAHHFVVSILLYLSRGACVCVPTGSLARPVLELAQRAGATVFYASPFHYNLLAKDISGAGLATVRLAVSTAEGLRAGIAAAFRARFGRPLVQALGIIEVGLPVINLVSAETKPEALGRPQPGYEVWLRGEDGKPLARTGPDHTGEICIRGTGMLDAYLEPWTPAREVLEPDGFRTGDQGWFDEDGDLHLAGRRANRINLAGMKFFCEEVEAVLEEHPGVRRSRVSARCHPHLGDIPVAEIEPVDHAQPPPRAELVAL
ncbi:MAG TPA: class I adenylate-forming enzyme family protein, partial [Myxococcota bacterium]|nr:class I adenylate-forming enzyme family protein [Myxococcota bacterium]